MLLLPSPPLFPSPTAPPGDAWLDLLLPALRGQLPLLFDRAARLAADDLDGRAQLCRSLVLSGEPDRARRLLLTLLPSGHPDALGLAPWLLRRPPLPPRAGAPWQRADAMCDQALWLLAAGREPAARRRLAQATRLVPHHAEAQHILDHLPGPLPPSLQPRAVCAWLSAERISRRLLCGSWTEPTSRSRGRVQAGLRTRLGLELPLESLADRVHTRRSDRLSAGDEAALLWSGARHLGADASLRVATWLFDVAGDDPSARPALSAAGEVLRLCGLPRPRRIDPHPRFTQRQLPR